MKLDGPIFALLFVLGACASNPAPANQADAPILSEVCTIHPTQARVSVRSSGSRPPLLPMSNDALSGYYPGRAARSEIWSGAATLRCKAANERVRDCQIGSVRPADYQFGETAMRLARWVRIPSLVDETTIDLTFDFQMTVAPSRSCTGGPIQAPE